jgi:hypothetical protein
MARYNPNMMMTDGGGDTTPNNPTLKTQFTPAQMQAIIRKLTSGQRLTSEEAAAVGVSEPSSISTPTQTPIVPTPPTVTWTKASTVNTANGPVDVDANGLAADGTRPVAVVAEAIDNGLQGFNKGPFPKELEQFFGSSAGIMGWKIINNPDGSQQLQVMDAPGSSKTFGFKFGVDNTGKYVKFNSSTGGGGNNTGLKTAAQIAADEKAALGQAERQSAYDLLYKQFSQYGLGALVEPLKGLITSGVSPSEFTIKLRESPAYQKRFAANAARIANGFAAIDEATYLGLEDRYQQIMQNYGLPANYYEQTVDPVTGVKTQSGFEKLIGNNVDSVTLEERIMLGKKRVQDSNPEVLKSLKQFYPDLTDSDVLAYVLDPKNALDTIKRKVTAAEIGGGAMQAGLGITGTRAEELGAAGITKQQAQQGFQTVAEVAPRGGQLAAIYGESPYTQQTAEQEVFGLAGATEAAKQRKKLVGLERAAFSGQTGAAQGALGRERAGNL